MCVLFMKPLAQDTFHEVSDHFRTELQFDQRLSGAMFLLSDSCIAQSGSIVFVINT